MTDRDEPKKNPNPAFLKTRTLGTRNLADLDYDDERPTGVNQPSERPPAAGPPRVDPNDVFYLTDRPAPHSNLPSFSDTAPGPGYLETPRQDIPPVTPVHPANPTHASASPLAHSPLPPTPQAPTPHRFPTGSSPHSVPMPLIPRSRPPKSPWKRKHIWKRVVPPPKFPPSEPLFPVIPPRIDALERTPKPVEDRLLNAVVVLFLGCTVAILAGMAFLTVTDTRATALSTFITKPPASQDADPTPQQP